MTKIYNKREQRKKKARRKAINMNNQSSRYRFGESLECPIIAVSLCYASLFWKSSCSLFLLPPWVWDLSPNPSHHMPASNAPIHYRSPSAIPNMRRSPATQSVHTSLWVNILFTEAPTPNDVSNLAFEKPLMPVIIPGNLLSLTKTGLPIKGLWTNLTWELSYHEITVSLASLPFRLCFKRLPW